METIIAKGKNKRKKWEALGQKTFNFFGSFNL